MNNQEINEDRVAGLLVEIASRLSPEGDSKQLVERALARVQIGSSLAIRPWAKSTLG